MCSHLLALHKRLPNAARDLAMSRKLKLVLASSVGSGKSGLTRKLANRVELATKTNTAARQNEFLARRQRLRMKCQRQKRSVRFWRKPVSEWAQKFHHLKENNIMDIAATLEQCLDDEEEVILADGFEEAFMGIARQFGKPFAVYSFEKCLEILQREMTEEDAIEYFYYNVEGAWVGENTPAFMSWADPEDAISED